MKVNYKTIAIVALATASVALMSCGGSKKAATPQQKATTNRGTKLDKEECETLAMERVKEWRAVGTANSQQERLAKNAATLNARANLAAALQAKITGLIKNFDHELQAGAGAGKAAELSSLSAEEQKSYFEGLITSRVICSNTYAKEDGSYTVYVCVEMGDETVSAIHKKLSNDKKISIQFDEKKFREELEKEKEDYRNSL